MLRCPLAGGKYSYVSLVAPLTNLATLWAVSLAFTAGYAAIAAGLVEKELVCRQRAEGDQRRYLLTITPLGRRINEELGHWLAAQADQLAQALELPCEDLEAANRVVSAMLTYCADLYRSGRLEI